MPHSGGAALGSGCACEGRSSQDLKRLTPGARGSHVVHTQPIWLICCGRSVRGDAANPGSNRCARDPRQRRRRAVLTRPTGQHSATVSTNGSVRAIHAQQLRRRGVPVPRGTARTERSVPRRPERSKAVRRDLRDFSFRPRGCPPWRQRRWWHGSPASIPQRQPRIAAWIVGAVEAIRADGFAAPG